MKISGINGANTQMEPMGMNQATDSYSKNIQNQIANAQKQLQELASNEDMTLEEKMKKRQEIQQQISDLNAQLRQHQIEQRKEKQQAKGSSMDDMLGGTGNAESTKAGNNHAGLSQASMTAMISADTSMKQAKVQGSVATKMEGIAGVLESEIHQDKASGGNTKKKEEELAEVKQKAQSATSSQLSELADANKTVKEAAKEDDKTEDTEEKESDKNVSGADTPEETANTQSDVSVSKNTAVSGTTAQPIRYTSVDIRL